MTPIQRLEIYQQRNQSFNKNLVFHLGVNAGFFSEFNNMILAMIYCYQHKIRFELYSDDANFKIDKGFSDFFVSFCTEVHDNRHSTLNWRWVNDDRHPHLRETEKLKKELNITYLTHNLWKKFNNYYFAYQYFSFPELEVKGFTREIARYFIEMVWQYNAKTKEKIEILKSKIHLPIDYTGFHIRGGDKIIEHSIVAGNEYINLANKIKTPKTGFILTDDYRIFESMCINYPEWEFQTLCNKNEHGYFHEEYMKLSKEQKAEQLLNLFAAVDILSYSTCFFGTYTSNPGMFLAMKMKKNKMVGLDYKQWKIRW